ncbi:MAG TPA: TfoX/Sxy family protein [Devosia sp.]|jgi:TfoX/Sxy family transcriptional regulator of competence genes|nr:TfoX/Sxy family protein [Devosia sp.]
MTAAADALVKRIRPVLARKPEIAERKMFGGLAFVFNGNMALFATSKGDMLVRVDPAKEDAALARSGASRAYMGEREMTGFINVAGSTTEDLDELKSWIKYAIDYTRTLPAK